MANFLQHEMKVTTKRWQKKKKKKRNHGKFLTVYEDHNKKMLVEQKMVISVLVVCLTIEFGFDWFSEITFTIWDQHFKEA